MMMLMVDDADDNDDANENDNADDDDNDDDDDDDDGRSGGPARQPIKAQVLNPKP